MKRKIITLFLAASMVLTSLTGCGSAEKVNSTDDSTVAMEDAEATKATANFNETGYPIVNEEITLKIMLAIRDMDTICAPEDMPAIQRLEELTGINTEWEVIKGADWETKLNLMFASGEYPDIIIACNGNVDDEEYGVTQQILLPLDDLIDQYMPNYKGRIEAEADDPTVSLIASDGQKYSIGYLVAQNINTDQHFFINQEWLDALQLDMPTDVESLTEVLRAFKNDDPNGNGEADEIPLEMGLDIGFGGVRYIMPMFGIPADPDKWIYIDDNKEIQFAPYQDGFRECMEWLHMCYEEGLVDPEIISQDATTVSNKLQKDNIGFFTCWRLKAMGYDEGVASNAVVWMPDSDASLYRKLEVAKAGAFLTCTNENVEASVRFLDAMLETETMFSLYYGEQDATDSTGWTYNENGKIDSLADNTSDKISTFLDCNAMFFAPGTYISEVFNMPEQRTEKTEYCLSYDNAGVIQKYSNDYLDMAPLTSEQIQSTSLLETDIKNGVAEYIAHFVLYGVSDDEWNEFVEVFENMNVADYMKIYQDAIDTMELE